MSDALASGRRNHHRKPDRHRMIQRPVPLSQTRRRRDRRPHIEPAPGRPHRAGTAPAPAQPPPPTPSCSRFHGCARVDARRGERLDARRGRQQIDHRLRFQVAAFQQHRRHAHASSAAAASRISASVADRQAGQRLGFRQVGRDHRRQRQQPPAQRCPPPRRPAAPGRPWPPSPGRAPPAHPGAKSASASQTVVDRRDIAQHADLDDVGADVGHARPRSAGG